MTVSNVTSPLETNEGSAREDSAGVALGISSGINQGSNDTSQGANDTGPPTIDITSSDEVDNR